VTNGAKALGYCTGRCVGHADSIEARDWKDIKKG
jgi:hypothetical protein